MVEELAALHRRIVRLSKMTVLMLMLCHIAIVYSPLFSSICFLSYLFFFFFQSLLPDWPHMLFLFFSRFLKIQSVLVFYTVLVL